jgi:hypothetical protein
MRTKRPRASLSRVDPRKPASAVSSMPRWALPVVEAGRRRTAALVWARCCMVVIEAAPRLKRLPKALSHPEGLKFTMQTHLHLLSPRQPVGQMLRVLI